MKKVSIHSRSNRYLCKGSNQLVLKRTVSGQLGWQRGLNLVPNLGMRFFCLGYLIKQQYRRNVNVRFKTSSRRFTRHD